MGFFGLSIRQMHGNTAATTPRSHRSGWNPDPGGANRSQLRRYHRPETDAGLYRICPTLTVSCGGHQPNFADFGSTAPSPCTPELEQKLAKPAKPEPTETNPIRPAFPPGLWTKPRERQRSLLDRIHRMNRIQPIAGDPIYDSVGSDTTVAPPILILLILFILSKTDAFPFKDFVNGHGLSPPSLLHVSRRLLPSRTLRTSVQTHFLCTRRSARGATVERGFGLEGEAPSEPPWRCTQARSPSHAPRR